MPTVEELQTQLAWRERRTKSIIDALTKCNFHVKQDVICVLCDDTGYSRESLDWLQTEAEKTPCKTCRPVHFEEFRRARKAAVDAHYAKAEPENDILKAFNKLRDEYSQLCASQTIST